MSIDTSLTHEISPDQGLDGWTRAGRLDELAGRGCTTISGTGPGIALFCTPDRAYAVDNRCPHMGFPLNQGTVQNGILTCHWHHARFDLESGGTFDPFADDVRVYPTRIVDGEVWVNLHPPAEDRISYWKGRLRDGLEQNISLVIAKAVLALLEGGVAAQDILAIGGEFGARYRVQGWGPGLTILTAMANVLSGLSPEDRTLALYHGMVHVARDVQGQAPRFSLDPLPTDRVPPERLKAWFRRFVEVRDTDGAERALLTAIEVMQPAQVADMLLAAATDHYFLAGGHVLDFINKACEYLDLTGWDEAPAVLPALVRGLCTAQRSEELNSWRNPVDLVELLAPVLAQLPTIIARGAERHGGTLPTEGDGTVHSSGAVFDDLVPTLLGSDPEAVVSRLVMWLEQGVSPHDLAGVLAYAAALRVARFHTSNEFSDWITVLHTFTYCNALHHSLERQDASPELARGVFHGAMRLYLDRFLNMPAARLPDERTTRALPTDVEELLALLTDLLDREQQVNRAGDVVYRYLTLGHGLKPAGRRLKPAGRSDGPLLALLGRLLLREDGEFHSYQMLEAGFRQYALLRDTDPTRATHVLVAVARYLAAHAPTSRAMLQTARNAIRLARGEALHEGAERAP